MKRFLSIVLVFILLFALAGCSDRDQAVHAYKKGKYEKALKQFEKLEDTEYINKCRFMLLYEYIRDKGQLTTTGVYAMNTTCISDLANIYLSVDTQKKEQIQVSFIMAEEVDGVAENYEISLTLKVGSNQGTYQIIQSKESIDGDIILTACDGTVDVSAYLTTAELEYERCERTVMNATVTTTTDNVNRSTRNRLFAYFSLAVDGLHEMLTLLDMGTTMKHLGFTVWEYVSVE